VRIQRFHNNRLTSIIRLSTTFSYVSALRSLLYTSVGKGSKLRQSVRQLLQGFSPPVRSFSVSGNKVRDMLVIMCDKARLTKARGAVAGGDECYVCITESLQSLSLSLSLLTLHYHNNPLTTS
jgi:hypothetical protein